jgi:hypothetical protein
MLLIRADHPDDAAAADDLALVTDSFYGRSDLHDSIPNLYSLISESRAASRELTHDRYNPSARGILRRQFQPDAIADQDPDEVASRAARRVRDDVTLSRDLHPVLCIGQCFPHHPFQ